MLKTATRLSRDSFHPTYFATTRRPTTLWRNKISVVASCNEYYYSTTPNTDLFHRGIRSFHSSTSSNTTQDSMKLSRHAPVALLFTTAAVLSFQPSLPLAQAEKFRFFSSKTNEAPVHEKKVDPSDCPFYGCPLKPIDVHYNTDDIKAALAELRNDKRINLLASEPMSKLSTAATDQQVTLTLIGYKGGSLESQINQDRSLIISPYAVYPIPHDAHVNLTENVNQPPKDQADNLNPTVQAFLNLDRILLGTFDGHAPLGERVSEFTATELPKVLALKLSTKAITSQLLLNEETTMDLTKEALVETFVELDTNAPADPSGGCTASVILVQGTKVYIANAGDSRSFVVAYRPSTNNVTVTYISREDKPNLPDERARVEGMGGQVYIPARGTSRVVYHDSTTGAPTGLAMSRSIGDWEAGKMGVIPNPIVDVLDIRIMVKQILVEDAGDTKGYQLDVVGSYVGASSNSSNQSEDDVYLFAVSATDGMMDYLAAPDIARILAHALFDDMGVHPVTAAEHLIFDAANAWQQSKQGRYRDDIVIAVAAIRRPPSSNVIGQ